MPLARPPEHVDNPFLKAGYGVLGGLLVIVAVISWACLTGHFTVGVMGVVALPVWMAASFIGLSVWALRTNQPLKASTQPTDSLDTAESQPRHAPPTWSPTLAGVGGGLGR